MTRNAAQGHIHMQIMWNRLISVVEEQARTIIRASFSPAVREAGDLAAGIFDTHGRMLAQAVTGTPGHVNTMAAAVPHFLAAYPLAAMEPGDCYITNDPWLASGHLHDFTVVTPAYYKDRAVGLFAATVHAVDVGGLGLGADGRQVFEEGICIPISPLAHAGVINDDLIKIIRANTREPLLVEGDLLAVAGACADGVRRLVHMMDEFAIDDLADLSEHTVKNSEVAIEAVIGELEPGTYTGEMTIDGYDEPVTLKAALTIADNRIHVDYDGTSGASPFGINVVLNYTHAYTTFGVKCLLATDIPNNFGSMGPITVSAPEGCILNAQRPAPVSARHIIGHAVPDLVLACLHQATGSGAPAESSMMWNPYFRGRTWFDGSPRPWEAFYFNNGGMGARPDKDGLSATAFPAGVSSIPAEVAETVAPLVVWRKELRPDSGGPGRFRGGLGQIVEIAALDDRAMAFSAMFDRVDHPAGGREGGQPGAAGRVFLKSGTIMRAKGMQEVPAGDRLVLELPGGGGFGEPVQRDPQSVAEDVIDGLVSREEAEQAYGVVVRADGTVDAEKTHATRTRER